jgi:hypothetical protein
MHRNGAVKFRSTIDNHGALDADAAGQEKSDAWLVSIACAIDPPPMSADERKLGLLTATSSTNASGCETDRRRDCGPNNSCRESYAARSSYRLLPKPARTPTRDERRAS